jgi:hypothetical protein
LFCGFLRRAEIIARDWIAEGSPDAMQSAAPVAVLHRNSRAEAMHLGRAFRALAHILRRELHLEERFARRLMRGKARRSRTDSGPSGERDIPIRSLGATSPGAGQFLPLPCRRNPSKSRAFWRCRGSPSSARRSIGEYLLHPIALRRGLGFETTLRLDRPEVLPGWPFSSRRPSPVRHRVGGKITAPAGALRQLLYAACSQPVR